MAHLWHHKKRMEVIITIRMSELWWIWGGSHDDLLCFWGYRRVCQLFFHSGHSIGQRGRKATTLWLPIELSMFGCTLGAAAVDRVGTELWMEITWPAVVWGFLSRVYCLVCLSAEVIIFSEPIVRHWKHIKVNERALEKIRRTYKSDVTVCKHVYVWAYAYRSMFIYN